MSQSLFQLTNKYNTQLHIEINKRIQTGALSLSIDLPLRHGTLELLELSKIRNHFPDVWVGR